MKEREKREKRERKDREKRERKGEIRREKERVGMNCSDLSLLNSMLFRNFGSFELLFVSTFKLIKKLVYVFIQCNRLLL
jgi:hypothetical protein